MTQWITFFLQRIQMCLTKCNYSYQLFLAMHSFWKVNLWRSSHFYDMKNSCECIHVLQFIAKAKIKWETDNVNTGMQTEEAFKIDSCFVETANIRQNSPLETYMPVFIYLFNLCFYHKAPLMCFSIYQKTHIYQHTHTQCTIQKGSRITRCSALTVWSCLCPRECGAASGIPRPSYPQLVI